MPGSYPEISDVHALMNFGTLGIFLIAGSSEVVKDDPFKAHDDCIRVILEIYFDSRTF
jgi:hypothetical protein